MNATLPAVEDCVKILVEKFPIGDIWLLQSEDVPEAEFEKPLNLVMFLHDEVEAHHVERDAVALLGRQFSLIAIHGFAQKAMFQTPRPLLVKMAFTKGHSVYRG